MKTTLTGYDVMVYVKFS